MIAFSGLLEHFGKSQNVLGTGPVRRKIYVIFCPKPRVFGRHFLEDQVRKGVNFANSVFSMMTFSGLLEHFGTSKTQNFLRRWGGAPENPGKFRPKTAHVWTSFFSNGSPYPENIFLFD